MRYSTFAVSLLVSSVTGWRLPDFEWSHQGAHHVSGSSAVSSGAPIKTANATVSFVASTQVPTVVATTAAVVDARWSRRTTQASKATATASTKAATSAASTGSSSSGSTGSSSDQKAALDAHNSARSDVGTSPLSWDDSLASDALAYAKTLASSGSFQHSGVSGQGENLYYQSGSSSPLANAVKSFLDEKSLYNGEAISSSNYASFGHYTQCVWKDTTKVGMGAATGSNGNTYVVARYQAPGNMIGEKAY